MQTKTQYQQHHTQHQHQQPETRDFNDPQCRMCGDYIDFARWQIGKRVCLECGEEQARQDRKLWCVLTPHKQGAMYFTSAFAREAAVGINNKGGLVNEGV